ncbi:MAG TPA: dTDP-4-dehydrorhamnose 3,5-epimerase [Patescibacteria group bacterium]|jgi:dTDP-4-dehydrorhamnose 3,5-epimerase|nr:dTDP-4-dehydrorhamnose 3,5-epimerase [Patescibacteria group bacterium]
MIVTNPPISGLKIITPDKFADNRGYFLKSFEKKAFLEQGIDFEIVQVNHSFNLVKGTLRGMHFQVEPFAQAKLIFCQKGRVFDVAIDLQKDSPTYKKWYGLELSEENKQILYIPKGFAHGFQTLEDNTEVIYYISNEYSKEHESGVKWDDPAFGINWPLEPTVIADKDKNWPTFQG